MGKEFRFDSTKTKEHLEKIFPDERIRKSYLKSILECAKIASSINNSNWNVNLDFSFLRFNTGNRYILQIESRKILVMCWRESFLNLDNNFIEEFLAEVSFHNSNPNHNPRDRDDLAQIPKSDLWNNSLQFEISSELWAEKYADILMPSVLDFLKDSIIHTFLVSGSRAAHSTGLIELINEQMNENLIQPEYVKERITVKYYKLGLKWGGMQNKSFFPLIKKYELSIGAKFETTPNDISICSEGFRIVAIMKTIENNKEIKDSRIINEFPEYGISPIDNKMYAAKCFIYELNQNQQFDVKIQQGTCELHDSSIIEKINELLPEFYEAFYEWYNSLGETSMQNTDDKLNEYVTLLKSTKNLILTGAPGTGKTYLAKQIAKEMGCTENEIGFVQFHQSYDYTDFVEGLRPVQDESGTGSQIGFERKDGVFKDFCAKALKNLVDSRKTVEEISTEKNIENTETIPQKNFVFIIDEINRGEVSKIFGELFYSVDPGYRGEKGRIFTQYQNLVTSGEFQKGFFIPENVYIIGTMNDIDRSVESMDFAFRRRFAWKEVKAEDTVEMLYPKTDENGNSTGLESELAKKAIERMNRLNDAIWKESAKNEEENAERIEGLSSAYHIGASYFLKLNQYDGSDEERFTKLWEYHLEGLLKEYLRGSGNERMGMEILRKAYFGKNKSDETPIQE